MPSSINTIMPILDEANEVRMWSLRNMNSAVCWRLVTATLVMTSLLGQACGPVQFEQRDKRFYYRALWNFALREN